MKYDLVDRKEMLNHWKAVMFDLPTNSTMTTLRHMYINVTRKTWYNPREWHAFYVDLPNMVVTDEQEMIAHGKKLVNDEIDKFERDEAVAYALMED